MRSESLYFHWHLLIILYILVLLVVNNIWGLATLRAVYQLQVTVRNSLYVFAIPFGRTIADIVTAGSSAPVVIDGIHAIAYGLAACSTWYSFFDVFVPVEERVWYDGTVHQLVTGGSDQRWIVERLLYSAAGAYSVWQVVYLMQSMFDERVKVAPPPPKAPTKVLPPKVVSLRFVADAGVTLFTLGGVLGVVQRGLPSLQVMDSPQVLVAVATSYLSYSGNDALMGRGFCEKMNTCVFVFLAVAVGYTYYYFQCESSKTGTLFYNSETIYTAYFSNSTGVTSPMVYDTFRLKTSYAGGFTDTFRISVMVYDFWLMLHATVTAGLSTLLVGVMVVVLL